MPVKPDPEKRFKRNTTWGTPPAGKEHLGPCLIYNGASNDARDPNGYRQFRIDGKNGYAHRYAWQRQHGPIPPGLTVDHLCCNKACVNIQHLELCTPIENYQRWYLARRYCRNGLHEVPSSGKCPACKSATSKRGGQRRRVIVDKRFKYSQTAVEDAISAIRAGNKSIADAARAIGCHPNYLGRRAWKAAERDALERDGGRCCRCGATAVKAHHLISSRNRGVSRPDLSFALTNLVSLCADCAR